MAWRELASDQLRRTCVPEKDFLTDFSSTEELESLHEILGQERATQAIEFGLGIPSYGYHIAALGPVGLGKTTAITSYLESRAPSQPTPGDWCYVSDMADPYRPKALSLPPGVAVPFRDAVDAALKGIADALRKAFDSETYAQARSRIIQDMETQRTAIFNDMQATVVQAGFALVQSPTGVALIPAVRGQPMTEQQLAQLDAASRHAIEARRMTLQEELERHMFKVRDLERAARARLEQVDRDVVATTIAPFLDEVLATFGVHAGARRHIDDVRADMIARADLLKALTQPIPPGSEGGIPAESPTAGASPYDRYRINVLVDHSTTRGAPVVVELSPTFYNLLGRIERRLEGGILMADHMTIRPGALHRANGGYLVVDGRAIVRNPVAWAALKRALRTTEIRLDELPGEQTMLPAVSLAPEPIPLNIKVIFITDPETYYALYQVDEEFQKLFKVRADFAPDMPWTPENVHKLARLIQTRCREENLRPLSPEAVAAVVEYAARLVEDQKKLTTRQALITDIVREATYWAGVAGHTIVQRDDVDRAIKERVYRSNLVEERMRELIAEGTILVDTDGQAVGQVNALSVMVYGDYAFGIPSRVTARVYPGRRGVINIEREARLSGSIHDKGVLILAGYLGGTYARTVPLSLSASLAFEQNYSGVEGDSASSGELFALLSALSGVPLRQDVAVTGSVNQQGQIQAVGGVIAKIEGFYSVCRVKGLTGRQGVIIPRANEQDLMLREDVVDAVRAGQFHIYSISTIDEGLELLTGLPAGERQPDGTFPPGTVNALVQERLEDFAQRVRGFGGEAV